MAHCRTEQASFHQVEVLTSADADDTSQGPTPAVNGSGASNPKLMVAPHSGEEDSGQSTFGARLARELYKLRATAPRRVCPAHSDSWASSASMEGTTTTPLVGSVVGDRVCMAWHYHHAVAIYSLQTEASRSKTHHHYCRALMTLTDALSLASTAADRKKKAEESQRTHDGDLLQD